ncbi:HAD family hydrolase [Novosphingobium sp. 1949]|uniref:HAD family hydrolase n=1 Tax=Novosphingobium organovorum TaxID=2930092 RepID=A0ABT0BHK7_9SPHN|nr:HAD family hydrolase [Novosphingobium organovorum]MCJ2184214.1 HAD family hydrolase [Novosphingobium organovorum]
MKPLLITDCDEVLLYMIGHFKTWLAEAHGVVFDLDRSDFYQAMRREGSGEALTMEQSWALLGAFFDSEMHRQTPVEGAVAAIGAIREHADVVVLTNLMDHRRDARAEQLRGFGLDLRVFTNQGPKGPALKAILDEYAPSRALFIDDLAQHHDSVATVAPAVTRLHLCAEPRLATIIPCAHEAGHAHARIDTWQQALPWLLDRLTGEQEDKTRDE